MTIPRPERPVRDPKDREAEKERNKVRFRINRARKRVNGVPVTNVYMEGFPTGTPYKEAVVTATEHAREQGFEGLVLDDERIETDEHKAAGEFLVKLQFGEEDPPEEEEPTDPGPKG